MKYLPLFRQLARFRLIGATLILASVAWVFGLPFVFTTATAATLSLVSATASSSAPGAASNYVIRFTTINGIGFAGSASTTRITFDPYNNAFDITTLATATDVFLSGGVTQVASAAACTGPTTNEMYISLIGRTQPQDFIEFTTCPSDTIPAGAMTLNLINNRVTNPFGIGSHVIRIGGGPTGPMTDLGDTRMAVIDRVTVTAIVDTNLTFTIAGVASSSVVNGGITSTTTTATAIAFGVLEVGASTTAAQDVSVATNAVNGFSVTVTQNQNLTSNNGADIDTFQNGNAVYPPAAWAAPAGSLGIENTYGHFGITSEDTSLPAGDEYGDILFAGLTSTSTRTVLYHTGSADGTTAHIGRTRVGYRAQVSSLQEAATDYTNQLTYVCTPIF
jgi:hypothetical protein